LIPGKVNLHYAGYWEPALDDFANYRFEWDVGLELVIWKGLALRADYHFAYEDLVVSGIQQDDGLMTFGLNYFFRSKRVNTRQFYRELL